MKLSDSLRTILRGTLKRKLQGLWKIKVFGRIKTEDDRAHYNRLGKFLKITNDSITFFKTKKDFKTNNYISNQEIKFCDLKTMFPIYNEVIHKNNNIWRYHVEEDGEVMRITDSGKIFIDGNRSEIISHPSGYTYNRVE
ncbi:hypothetical protein LVD13_05025 [Flavobacteriaceae bacterium D16]|nr:hypothetical protein [Flavobacteriaceae bacterium D16]